MKLFREWQKKNNLEYNFTFIPPYTIYNINFIKKGEIILLIDEREPMIERLIDIMKKQNIKALTRKLPVGDYMWIIKDENEEKLLPYIIERKTWDDFYESKKSGRFQRQKKLLKLSGIENLIWLFEGNKKKCFLLKKN
jgi:ERCC4-type nuclease